uniref:MFS transporter n=1 Tax=Rhodococcus qingshengii TaxID=334542 RepID=UPI001C4DD9DF|nr:MFS transporter [Rhodococcus qingshengii]
MAQLTPFQLLLPIQINETVHSTESDWLTGVVNFGLISALSAICAIIGLPLAGALSDRTVGRFGRRRPWIAGGTITFAIGLTFLARQGTIVGIALWWCVSMLGFCAVATALTALIKDRVPHEQRGTVAGTLSMAQAGGLIVGLGSVSMFSLLPSAAYPLIAALLTLCVVPFVLDSSTEAAAPIREVLPAESVMSLLKLHDYRWALIGRVAVNLGNALATCLLIFYLQFDLRVSDPDEALLIVTVAYVASVLSVSVLSGWWSDRIGRRKPFVIGSALIQTAAALMFLLADSLWIVTISGMFIGAGYGTFLAVDQALAADILPNAENSGKELGIMNIALVVPGAVSPLIGAAIVEASAGSYSMLFVTAGLFTLFGGLSAMRIRSVR